MGYVVSLIDRMKAELETLKTECEALERLNELLADELRRAQNDADLALGDQSE